MSMENSYPGNQMAKDKAWIQSFTGKRIELANPDSSQICIEDIAHALSRICRYTGHTKRTYVVSEHSVWVSRRAVQLFDQNRGLDFPSAWRAAMRIEIARYGLLHDATEAYLGDVSRPLKRLPGMEAYRKLERQWEQAIMDKFNVHIYAPEVAQADAELLGTEARQLLPGGPRADWPDLPEPIRMHPRMGWPPFIARWLFMREFRRLFQ